MHTLMVIFAGLVVLGCCLGVGRWLGGPDAVAKAALVFLPVWAVGASVNLYVGVKQAGYTVAEEAPVLLVVFGVPAALALFAWWKLRS